MSEISNKDKKTSFGELVNLIGIDNFLDIYVGLTRQNGNIFNNLPIIPIDKQLIENKEIVIDFSVICLLFMLEKEGVYKSKQKYTISSFTRGIIRNLTIKESWVTEDIINLNYTNDGLISNILMREYLSNRYKIFEELIEWVEKNTISKNSNYALEILKAEGENKGRKNAYIESVFDNVGLAQSGYLLVTDDSFYINTVQLQNTEFTGSLFLFENLDISEKEKINNYLLGNNYNIFELNITTCLNEFNKYLSNINNCYLHILDRININVSFNAKNITIGIILIRKIAQNISIPDGIKNNEIKRIFIQIISCNNSNVNELMKLLLHSTFKDNPQLLSYVVSIYNSILNPIYQ